MKTTPPPFTITIERHIPLPPQPRRTGQLGPVKTALLAMKKGDSFTVADERAVNRVRQNAQDLRLAIAARRLADGTFRIWHDGARKRKGGK